MNHSLTEWGEGTCVGGWGVYGCTVHPWCLPITLFKSAWWSKQFRFHPVMMYALMVAFTLSIKLVSLVCLMEEPVIVLYTTPFWNPFTNVGPFSFRRTPEEPYCTKKCALSLSTTSCSLTPPPSTAKNRLLCSENPWKFQDFYPLSEEPDTD